MATSVETSKDLAEHRIVALKTVCLENLKQNFGLSTIASVTIHVTEKGNGWCEGDLPAETLDEMNQIIQDTLNPYDVILLLDVHGAIYPVQDGPVITCDTQEFEGDRVTFLQAASCGSPNYAGTDWYHYARTKCTETLTLLGPIRAMADSLQHDFREDKQAKLKDPSSYMVKSMKKDGMESESVKAFIRTPGWDIRSDKIFADREYILDDKYPCSVIVVHSALGNLGFQVGDNLKSLFPRGTFTRSELLHFLYVRGARNPFIIDNSCGEVCTRSARKARAVKRDSAGFGGKRTKRRFRRNTKRTRKPYHT
jgi:hypothetical protein